MCSSNSIYILTQTLEKKREKQWRREEGEREKRYKGGEDNEANFLETCFWSKDHVSCMTGSSRGGLHWLWLRN